MPLAFSPGSKHTYNVCNNGNVPDVLPLCCSEVAFQLYSINCSSSLECQLPNAYLDLQDGQSQDVWGMTKESVLQIWSLPSSTAAARKGANTAADRPAAVPRAGSAVGAGKGSASALIHQDHQVLAQR